MGHMAFDRKQTDPDHSQLRNDRIGCIADCLANPAGTCFEHLGENLALEVPEQPAE